MKRDAPTEYKGHWIAVVVTPEGTGSRGQYWIAKGEDGSGIVRGQTLLPSLAVTDEDAWYAAELAAKAYVDGLS
jgi:hypothetical protein